MDPGSSLMELLLEQVTNQNFGHSEQLVEKIPINIWQLKFMNQSFMPNFVKNFRYI